jgi:hypothetical protein
MATLVARIESDNFLEPTSEWLSCMDPLTPAKCAMSWARESNAWNCRYVYQQLHNDTDLLASGYAERAFPIVELQISKAALRLAGWLNKLAAGDYDAPSGLVLQTNPRQFH